MKRPYLIGIGGGTASGKSTFSAYLEKQLQTYRIMVFHMDSYFKSKEIRPKAKAPVSGKSTWMTTALKPFIMNNSAGIWKPLATDNMILSWWKGSLLFGMIGSMKCLTSSFLSTARLTNALCGAYAGIWQNRGLSFDEISEVYLDMVRYRHEQFIEPTKWRELISFSTALPLLSWPITFWWTFSTIRQ